MLVVALPMHHWEYNSNFAEEAPTNAKEQLGLDMLAQCAMGKGANGSSSSLLEAKAIKRSLAPSAPFVSLLKHLKNMDMLGHKEGQRQSNPQNISQPSAVLASLEARAPK